MTGRIRTSCRQRQYRQQQQRAEEDVIIGRWRHLCMPAALLRLPRRRP